MPTVHIPAPLRTLTGGEAAVAVEGSTLGELVDNLEIRFPGIKSRLVGGDRIRPGLAVFLNSVQASSSLDTKVANSADIYFAPAISGGNEPTCR